MKNALKLKTFAGLVVLAAVISFCPPAMAGGGHGFGGRGFHGHGFSGRSFGGRGFHGHGFSGRGFGGGLGYSSYHPRVGYAPAYRSYRTNYVAPRRGIRRGHRSHCGR